MPFTAPAFQQSATSEYSIEFTDMVLVVPQRIYYISQLTLSLPRRDGFLCEQSFVLHAGDPLFNAFLGQVYQIRKRLPIRETCYVSIFPIQFEVCFCNEISRLFYKFYFWTSINLSNPYCISEIILLY